MLPKNFNSPLQHVKFYELLPYSGSFKSVCPFCDGGIFAVCRHPETGELIRMDVCLLCAQHVIYDDFKLMKKLHGRDEAMKAEAN